MVSIEASKRKSPGSTYMPMHWHVTLTTNVRGPKVWWSAHIDVSRLRSELGRITPTAFSFRRRQSSHGFLNRESPPLSRKQPCAYGKMLSSQHEGHQLCRIGRLRRYTHAKHLRIGKPSWRP